MLRCRRVFDRKLEDHNWINGPYCWTGIIIGEWVRCMNADIVCLSGLLWYECQQFSFIICLFVNGINKFELSSVGLSQGGGVAERRPALDPQVGEGFNPNVFPLTTTACGE